jgi:hypothetical protein
MFVQVAVGYSDGSSECPIYIDCPDDHLPDFQRFNFMDKLHICWFESCILGSNCSLVLEQRIIWSNCCIVFQLGMLGRQNMMFVQVVVGFTDGITERPICIDCPVDHQPDFLRFD